MSGSATGSLPSEQLAEQLAEKHAEILEVRSPIAVAGEERSYAAAKKWSVRKSILFAFVMSAVLWAFIILGVLQLF